MTERIPDPATQAEYLEKSNANIGYEGRFLDTTVVAPCPACAEPGWAKWKVIEVEKAMTEEHVCKNCGRGFKAIVTKAGNATNVEFVQTCGEDCPPYVPPIRRA